MAGDRRREGVVISTDLVIISLVVISMVISTIEVISTTTWIIQRQLEGR